MLGIVSLHLIVQKSPARLLQHMKMYLKYVVFIEFKKKIETFFLKFHGGQRPAYDQELMKNRCMVSYFTTKLPKTVRVSPILIGVFN